MRNIFKSLWRTLVLLVCSIIQIYAALFLCIAAMFGWVGNALEGASNWMLKKLDEVKYEGKFKTTVE
jgi:hypothetical protein